MNEQARRHADADEIVALERAALDRWGRGDPGGFLDVYAADVTYFDPLTAARLDGHDALARYYAPWTGLIHIDRFEMQGAQVCIEGDMAVLTYNLVNYAKDQAGAESVGSRWNSTAVYRRREGRWQSVHVHWSFTEHPAFQQVTVASAEREGL
jgi:ketosteroid isomerase-like protein